MIKRTSKWMLLTLGLAAASGCSGDDSSSGTGAGGSAGSGGTVRDGAADADGGVHPDASGGSDARADASSDSAADVSQESSPGEASTAEAGDVSATDAADATDATDAAHAIDATDARGDGALTTLQARGRYLVNNVIACPDCHTPQTPTGPDPNRYLAGDPNFVVLPNGDHLGSRNLTNDPTGLANRTDTEIKNMFLNGTRPVQTGQEALNPIMPYYVLHNMKPEDADAIVAYLRTVPGINNEIPRRSVSFDVPTPANFLDLSAVPTPAAGDAGDAATESALRGRYLAAAAGLCIECHTQHQSGPDAGLDVLTPGAYFQGGEDFSAFFAGTLMIHPVSKNLTSDLTTGLGTWTTDDIVRVLKQGRAKDGTGICPPMPSGPMGAYGGLTDGDALDIANYIKSLPPVVHSVPDMCVFPPAPPGEGGVSEAGDGASSSDSAAEADDSATGDATGG